MAIIQKTAVPSTRPLSRTLHFTRQELKEYIERFEITAIEKITKVFGGLPCRTVKVFPLPDDFEPETFKEFFSDVSGHVLATLTYTENHVKAMFVSFTFEESVQFALKKSGQSIGSSPNEVKVNVQILPDADFLKFLQAIVTESRFFLHGEKIRRFQNPDPRGTTLSEELDIFLSVLRSTLHREHRKADEEENAKPAASNVGSEQSLEEYSSQTDRKPNKFEIAYANKKVKEYDLADPLPESNRILQESNRILQESNRIRQLEERRSWRPLTRFSYITVGALVVTVVVACYLLKTVDSGVGGGSVISEATNFVE